MSSDAVGGLIIAPVRSCVTMMMEPAGRMTVVGGFGNGYRCGTDPLMVLRL
jgi:hypothetical protein